MSYEKKEPVFTKGLRFWDKHANAPDWVIGKISIKPTEFTQWMRDNYDKDEEYLNIEVKRSKASNEPYTELSTFKPTKGKQSGNNAPQAPGRSPQASNDTFVDDCPF